MYKRQSIVFASNLAEEDDWGNTSPENENGLTIFEVNLYSANTILGTYYMRLGHNANNEVGIAYNYVGMSGGSPATLTAELRVTFTPTDAPAASGGGSAGLTFGSEVIVNAPASGPILIPFATFNPTTGLIALRVNYTQTSTNYSSPVYLIDAAATLASTCLLYTSPSPRD